jgi:tyrosinase
MERGPSPQRLLLIPIQVCRITLEQYPSLLTKHIPDLTPFWNTQTTFWASSGTKTTEALNYTYPEFNDLKPDEVQQAIIRFVNDCYGGSKYGPSGSIVAQPPPAPPVPRLGLPVTAAVSAVKSVAEAAIRDWTCRIRFKKHELHQSFAIRIFLGNSVPNDPSQWRTSSTYVGSHVAFVNSAAERCANCREQADIVCEGFVHLNVAISKLSGLPSFDPNVVTPFLQKSLHWGLQAVRFSFSTNLWIPTLLFV